MDVLSNQVRDYAWGSTTAIPELLGVPATGKPQAELWLGAHERAPSSIRRAGRAVGLDEVIAADPQAELGAELAGHRRLPFLAKILAVERPLSLQVHPNAEQARRGHAREEAAGLHADAPERGFPDRYPKPELVYAVTEFHALCGFRDSAEAERLLRGLGIAELDQLASAPVSATGRPQCRPQCRPQGRPQRRPQGRPLC